MATDKKVESFVSDLQGVYASQVESVILFGSAAAGDHHSGHSDYNLLVMLKDLSLPQLKKGSKLVRQWIALGNPAPLFINQEHIQKSLDIFPIEFLDMQDAHQVLVGSDPLSHLSVNREHLRLQCETELKGKLIALRTAYLQTAGSQRKIKKLMLGSVSGFFAILRGVLRLVGESPSPKKGETLKKLAGKIPCDLKIFSDLLAVREGTMKISRSEVEVWMERYLTTVEAITKFVDAI